MIRPLSSATLPFRSQGVRPTGFDSHRHEPVVRREPTGRRAEAELPEEGADTDSTSDLLPWADPYIASLVGQWRAEAAAQGLVDESQAA